MERLLRAIFRVNKEARRMVREMADTEFDEWNDELPDDEDALQVPDRDMTTEALRFRPPGERWNHDDVWDDMEDEDDLDEAPLFVRLANWGVPHYIWDAAKTHLKDTDQYTEERHEEEVYLWTLLKAQGRTSTPFHYAICASSNLQASILDTTLKSGAHLLWSVLYGHEDHGLAGVRGISAKGRRWLLLDWEAIGRTYLGIQAPETLELFVKEREAACEIGVCDKKLVSEVDRRYKGGMVLDLSVFQ